jgi:hypothetical protein
MGINHVKALILDDPVVISMLGKIKTIVGGKVTNDID